MIFATLIIIYNSLFFFKYELKVYGNTPTSKTRGLVEIAYVSLYLYRERIESDVVKFFSEVSYFEQTKRAALNKT